MVINTIRQWIGVGIGVLALLGYFVKLNVDGAVMKQRINELEKEDKRLETVTDAIWEERDEIGKDIAEIKTDIKWIKKYMEDNNQ